MNCDKVTKLGGDFTHPAEHVNKVKFIMRVPSGRGHRVMAIVAHGHGLGQNPIEENANGRSIL
jgi:hypothetical protein